MHKQLHTSNYPVICVENGYKVYNSKQGNANSIPKHNNAIVITFDQLLNIFTLALRVFLEVPLF